MNQKNRIEPTFGRVNETPESHATSEHSESTLERINKSSEVLASLAPKQTSAVEPSKLDSNPVTEVKSEQPKATVSPFISMKTNNAPSHTFSQPLTRPTNAIESHATIEEMQQVNREQVLRSQASVVQQGEQPNEQAISRDVPTKMTAPQPTMSMASGTISANSVAQKVEPTETPVVKANMERVIPTAAGASSTPEDKKENMPKVPSKFRRLLAVILLVLLGGVAFWLLKPNTPQTVAELENQSQSNSLPIEFRPVNEEEAKAAEAREADALAQQQAQQQVSPSSAENPTGDTATATPSEPSVAETTQNDGVIVTQGSVVENPSSETATQPATENTDKVETPKVAKPNSQGSVIHQPERKTTKVETDNKPKVKAITADEYKAKVEKNARLDKLIQNVESGKTPVAKSTTTKPASVNAAPAQKVVATAAPAVSNGVVSSKTMTVPKSTSLMQVFRDNGLNISDVNAMSRANGIVSNLKVNEKITVRLDKNNRVVEMSIGSGGRFTRQADGSYRFK